MTTWQVRCADGVVRVEEAFPSRRAAVRHMTWDHFCYFDPHRVVPVRPASDPNRDLAQREAGAGAGAGASAPAGSPPPSEVAHG